MEKNGDLSVHLTRNASSIFSKKKKKKAMPFAFFKKNDEKKKKSDDEGGDASNGEVKKEKDGKKEKEEEKKPGVYVISIAVTEATAAGGGVFRVEGDRPVAAAPNKKKGSLPGSGKDDFMIQSVSAETACTHTVQECAEKLRTDVRGGLSNAEAARRRQFHGYNEFDVKEDAPVWCKYLEQFKNPLILLLLASATVSLLMKQFDDAISITVAVVIVVTVGFIQEYRSEKTLEQLNNLVPPEATVWRDGRDQHMLARELVPGDIVLLHMGDRIPADLRLFETVDLQVDESSLTGEAEPKHKQIIPMVDMKGADVSHMNNIAFMGTFVCSGRGRGIVTTTGMNTHFGQLAAALHLEEKPKTPLQNSMDHLGTQLSIYSFGVIAVIFVIGLVQGRNALDMFTIGVSLAVAAIPEGLPIVVAVTLAIGVIRMANRHAVVKKLPAVETLGCVTVICSDKTGTLTKNEMTATSMVTPQGRRADVSGVGYRTDGQITCDAEQVSGHSHPEFARLIEVGCVCNNAQVRGDGVIGQPTEGALLVLARKAHLEGIRDRYERIQEIPFTHDTKWMAVECTDHNNQRWFFVKGAGPNVIAMCDSYVSDDGRRVPLDQRIKDQMEATSRSLGNCGLRVLAMARGESLRSLCFVGVVGIIDPPREGACEAIETVRGAHVQVKMITGDSAETAQAIGARLGLFQSGDSSLSGHQLDEMTDAELELVIRQVVIFYRASPRHKSKIVKALQALGEVVAMTGDGVNDAVALKKADIGIAMGTTGTDVCKEAADMIIVNDDFMTIRAAIEEGKGIYHNITNFVRFQLSTSVAALSLIALSTLFHFENPLNAMQILWINIIMDGPPAQSLGVEPVDADIIRQKARNVKDPLLSKSLIFGILSSAAVIIAGTLFVFYREMSADNKITPRDTTMTFTCFVLFDMWNALSCRSNRKMIWEIGLFRFEIRRFEEVFRNRMFCLAVSGSLLCQLAVIYWSPLQHIFQTEALSLLDLVFLTAMTSSVFFFNETRKFLELKSRKNCYDDITVNEM